MKLDDAKGFDATVSGFDAGDKLDVAGFVASTTSLSFVENGSGTSGILQLTDGSATAQIFIAGNHTADGFHLGSDGAGGSLVTYGTSGAVASKATVHTDPHTAGLAAALFDGAFSLAIASSPLSAPPHAPSMAVLAAHS